jgi:hypothetical protein
VKPRRLRSTAHALTECRAAKSKRAAATTSGQQGVECQAWLWLLLCRGICGGVADPLPRVGASSVVSRASSAEGSIGRPSHVPNLVPVDNVRTIRTFRIMYTRLSAGLTYVVVSIRLTPLRRGIDVKPPPGQHIPVPPPARQALHATAAICPDYTNVAW